MFLRLPLVKDIVLYSVVERVTRILGAMVKAGVPLPDTHRGRDRRARTTRCSKPGSKVRRSACSKARASRRRSPTPELFPEAGDPDDARRRGDGNARRPARERGRSTTARELEYKLKKLTTLFEPAVIIFMGVIVGFVAVALISAMYGIFGQSKNIGKK